MNEDTFKKFKTIIKKHEGVEIFVGNGRKQSDIKSVDTKEFFDDVMKWGEESKKGLVCGIFGCIEPVDIRCKICNGGYCLEHKNIHFHSRKNDGVIVREIETDDFSVRRQK